SSSKYTAATAFSTLSLHDALPISPSQRNPVCRLRAGKRRNGETLRPGNARPVQFVHARPECNRLAPWRIDGARSCPHGDVRTVRSEEHTSELQSRGHLVCRLLLEK